MGIDDPKMLMEGSELRLTGLGFRVQAFRV